jgi:hypothetical protein
MKEISDLHLRVVDKGLFLPLATEGWAFDDDDDIPEDCDEED